MVVVADVAVGFVVVVVGIVVGVGLPEIPKIKEF